MLKTSAVYLLILYHEVINIQDSLPLKVIPLSLSDVEM